MWKRTWTQDMRNQNELLGIGIGINLKIAIHNKNRNTCFIELYVSNCNKYQYIR